MFFSGMSDTGGGYGIRRDRVCCDHWIGAPKLLGGLPQVALDHERLASCSSIECRDTHDTEPAFEGDAFCAWFARTGDTGPYFHCGQR